jgi:hypothetical protein
MSDNLKTNLKRLVAFVLTVLLSISSLFVSLYVAIKTDVFNKSSNFINNEVSNDTADTAVSDEASGMLVNVNSASLMSLNVVPFSSDHTPNLGDSSLNETSSGTSSDTSSETSSSAHATSSKFQITATVSPDNASDKILSWDLSWSGWASSWSSGKSVLDYISLVVSDDTLSVTLYCKQAFGDRIALTCSSSSNSSITATATLDYERRVLGSNLYLRMLDEVGSDILNLNTTSKSCVIDFPVFSDTVLNNSQSWAYDAGNYTPAGCTEDNTQGYQDESYSNISYTYSAYTVLPDWELLNYPSTYDKVYVGASDWYLDCLDDADFKTTVFPYEYIPLSITNYYGKESAHVSYAGIFLNAFSSATAYQTTSDEGPSSTRWNSLKELLYSRYSEYESHLIKLKFETYSYTDDTLLSTTEYSLWFNQSTFSTSATAIALSYSNIVL